MKILILGGGTVGETVAYNLANYSNYEITVIDKNEATLQKLSQSLDIQTILGSVSSPTVLKNAGAQDTELLIAVTGEDDTNLVASKMAKEIFNIPNIIARIRKSEIVEYGFKSVLNDDESEMTPLDLFNVNESICPEQIVTDQLFQLLLIPGALQVINFAEDLEVQMIVTKVENSCLLVGKQFSEFVDIIPEEINFKICAIYRNEALVIPTPKTKIISGDEVYFITLKEHVKDLMDIFRPDETGNKKVMIAGGGNIGYRLAQTTEPYFQTKIIEKNHSRAEFLAENLDSSLVFRGSATDEDILIDEHVEEIDMFFALTNDAEDNIMSSLIAKKLGAKRVATIINRSIYVDILVGHTIDIVISPHLTTIGSILSHIRRGDVVTVHPMRRGEAEILEVIIHGDKKTSKIIGRKPSQISWPYGIDVAAIISNGKFITDHKHDLKEGDHIIFFVFRRQAVPELEKLLQVKWKFF
ncbi:Trk system potassium transporter TrkA [Neisseriaceae bacterium PsAf]|nr:Trk system potassium transporter TrkA [Neisseriaceae bacterium PsAf]MCV2503306.1 Trk system potassium transporter TrkA [Neisseriaceae bacterium]